VLAQKPYFPVVPPDLAELFHDHELLLVGIADASPAPEEQTRYRDWLAEGNAGSMAYLHTHAEAKYDPALILPGCRSILMAGINYFQDRPQAPSEPHGRIARYAWGRDYHKTLGKRLRRIAATLSTRYPGESFRSFTDATPLAERYYAEKAGVGFTGRNTLLITAQYGSWLLIGEILSTREFPASGPAYGHHGACPSGCRRCIDICPTGALKGPHKIDASLCISYLTIEHKGEIPEHLRPAIGNWLFGCDLCQEVCPLNVRAQITSEDDFLSVRAGDHRLLREILSIETEEQFTRKFAGSPLMRAKRRGLLRNACVVAGNVGAEELIPILQKRVRDHDPLIQVHARWALSRLQSESALPGNEDDAQGRGDQAAP